MKVFKALLIALVLLGNLVFAQPSLADKPKFTKNPDYIEVTKALNNLSQSKNTQTGVAGSTPDEIQNKIAELEFQKYALETGVNWGQCRNETANTLAVYGPAPDFDDDDDEYSSDNALYFLGAGQTTKNKWDCNGVYLPNDVNITTLGSNGQDREVAGPVAIKILDGSQLVIKTNPDTGAIEFNIPIQPVKTGEAKWFIPNVSQAVIDARIPNAPGVKISNVTNVGASKNPEPAVVQSNIPPKTQPQPQYQPQAKSPSQEQPQAQQKWQPNLPKPGLYNKQ